MIVFVIINDKSYIINCNLSDTISDLRIKLNKKVNFENDNYWLSHSGKLLLNGYKVFDYLTNESTIFLNYRPLEFVKVKYGDKYCYIELSILMESSLLPYNFNFNSLDKNNILKKIIDNFDYIIYDIPERYFDENIYKIWYSIYKLTKKEKKISFEKPITNNKYTDPIYLKYLNILDKLSFNELIKLNNLMGYLEVEYILEIVSFYLANEYFYDICSIEIIKFLESIN